MAESRDRCLETALNALRWKTRSATIFEFGSPSPFALCATVIWRLPLYNTVHNNLTNPVYAGAYAFGRTASKVVVENGRKRIRRGLRRPLAAWDMLLRNKHEGYIGWSAFEKNQQVIADHTTFVI